jgi:Tfp pilus assembly protein PilX
MSFDPQWYTQHPTEEKKPVSLDGISLEQFDGVVQNATVSNKERIADAISKADSYSFQLANPWFKRTTANNKLVNHWLTSKGITNPTYPDFTEATGALVNAGLLDIDEVEHVKHLDGNGPTRFKGALTKRDYDSLESMIAQERQAAIEQQSAVQQSDMERAFDRLPIEDAQALLRDAERQFKANENAKISQQNADSWLTLHPEFRDDTGNGKLMLAQLRLNGVVNRAVTVEDYEVAERQLVTAGLLRQNPAQLKKIQAQAVIDRAQAAVNEPGSVFDKTSEEEMYQLPLDEVRRRANGNYSGIDRF